MEGDFRGWVLEEVESVAWGCCLWPLTCFYLFTYLLIFLKIIYRIDGGDIAQHAHVGFTCGFLCYKICIFHCVPTTQSQLFGHLILGSPPPASSPL